MRSLLRASRADPRARKGLIPGRGCGVGGGSVESAGKPRSKLPQAGQVWPRGRQCLSIGPLGKARTCDWGRGNRQVVGWRLALSQLTAYSLYSGPGGPGLPLIECWGPSAVLSSRVSTPGDPAWQDGLGWRGSSLHHHLRMVAVPARHAADPRRRPAASAGARSHSARLRALSAQPATRGGDDDCGRL